MDADAAGHYYHSTAIRWVGAAETVLLDRLNLTELLAPRRGSDTR